VGGPEGDEKSWEGGEESNKEGEIG
jgi:hypothetical protein